MSAKEKFDPDFAALTARLYYEERMPQQKMADTLGISQSKISRILRRAEEAGIVRITVAPYEPRARELEARLKKTLSIDEAVVVKTFGGTARDRRMTGLFAAPELARLLEGARVAGVAGGRNIQALVESLEEAKSPSTAVVQLMGNTGPTPRPFDASETGRRLAGILGGSFYALNAPVYADSVVSRDRIMRQEQVGTVARLFDELDTALIGMGTIEDSILSENGVFDAETGRELKARGAVGETCGRFFDRNGAEMDTPLRKKTISVTLERLGKCGRVVAAATGAGKAETVRAAARGGLFSVLLTDESCAKAVLSLRG